MNKLLVYSMAFGLLLGAAAVAFFSPEAEAGQGQVTRTTAQEAGRCETVAQTAENALPVNGSRQVFCLYANDGNTDELRFKLGATATTAAGFVLNAGSSFCDPVGDTSTWGGYVSIIAESGTQTYCVLAY